MVVIIFIIIIVCLKALRTMGTDCCPVSEVWIPVVNLDSSALQSGIIE